MTNKIIENYLKTTLEKANITLNGKEKYDIQILDERAIPRIAENGSLGLGESYMEGWWSCENLDELSYYLFLAGMDKDKIAKRPSFWYHLSRKILNHQNKNRSKEVAQKHYDLDNELFSLMLDHTLAYSCAYWKEADNLEEAQLAKYELICQKLMLKPEDRVLDMGCGWGGLAAYIAEHYGCHVVGISIAENQIAYAKERYQKLPLAFCQADYRDVSLYNPTRKHFSKLVSVGAFEHIGNKNYSHFLTLMKNMLADDGLFLLHTIGNDATVEATDPFINKYIFPNGIIPSMVQLTQALESVFVVEDWHNFGNYYDNTLMAWHANFETHWPKLENRFDNQFYRMWRYYLLMCAGMFRARAGQLWQIVLSKSGIVGGYESIR